MPKYKNLDQLGFVSSVCQPPSFVESMSSDYSLNWIIVEIPKNIQVIMSYPSQLLSLLESCAEMWLQWVSSIIHCARASDSASVEWPKELTSALACLVCSGELQYGEPVVDHQGRRNTHIWQNSVGKKGNSIKFYFTKRLKSSWGSSPRRIMIVGQRKIDTDVPVLGNRARVFTWNW